MLNTHYLRLKLTLLLSLIVGLICVALQHDTFQYVDWSIARIIALISVVVTVSDIASVQLVNIIKRRMGGKNGKIL